MGFRWESFADGCGELPRLSRKLTQYGLGISVPLGFVQKIAVLSYDAAAANMFVFFEVIRHVAKDSYDLERQAQRVQGTNIVQSMVSVVVISLMVWVSIPHMGT